MEGFSLNENRPLRVFVILLRPIPGVFYASSNPLAFNKNLFTVGFSFEEVCSLAVKRNGGDIDVSLISSTPFERVLKMANREEVMKILDINPSLDFVVAPPLPKTEQEVVEQFLYDIQLTADRYIEEDDKSEFKRMVGKALKKFKSRKTEEVR